jgi:hypothetical protein
MELTTCKAEMSPNYCWTSIILLWYRLGIYNENFTIFNTRRVRIFNAHLGLYIYHPLWLGKIALVFTMVLTQIMIRVFSRLEISTEYQFWYCDVDIHRWILLHHYWCPLLIHVSLPIYIPVQPRSQPLTYQLHASSNKHTDVFWTWRIHGFSRGVCSGGFSPHATLDRIPEADLASKLPREVGIGNINAKMANSTRLGDHVHHRKLLCLKITSQQWIFCSGSANRHTKPH